MNLLFSLLILANMFSVISVSIIAPFFPPLAEEKGFSAEMTGLVLSSNPLGSFIASFFIGKTMTKNNRVWLMIVGLIIQAVGLSLFVFVEDIDQKKYLIPLCTISRLIQGLGSAMFTVPVYSLIAILYPQDVEKKNSQMEVSVGIGYVAGPVFGGIIYNIGGYKAPFIFFAGAQLILSPLIYKILTKELKAFHDSQIDSEQNTLSKIVSHDQLFNEENQIVPVPEVIIIEIKKINYYEVFQNLLILLNFIILTTSTLDYMYFEPIFSTYLHDEYNVDEKYIGYYLSVGPFTYIIITFICGYVKEQKKEVIFIGTLIGGISFFFSGPDATFTGINKNLVILNLSQALNGLSCAMIFVPALPLLNDILIELYPNNEQTSDIASALFTAGISLGELIGPLAGGFMTQQFGYRHGCSYTGFLVIGLGLLYGLVFFIKPKTKNVVVPVEKQSLLD